MDVDHSDDDWLDSAPDEKQPSAADKEWDQLEEKFSNEGYREGITAGKLANLQTGFDEGYVLASAASRHLGFLRGSSSSLLAFLLATPASRHPGPSTSPAPENLEQIVADTRALVGRLARIRAGDIIPADKEAEAHAREHDGVDWEEGEAKEMDDLERALEGIGHDKPKEEQDAALLNQLEETLESLLVRAGLQG